LVYVVYVFIILCKNQQKKYIAKFYIYYYATFLSNYTYFDYFFLICKQANKIHATGGIKLGELNRKKTFDTDFTYVIIAGWLIIPAIEIVFSFIGIISSLIVNNPFAYDGSDPWIYIFSYVVSWLYIPLFIYIIVVWFKRKKLLPKLMILYYLISVLLAVTFMFYFRHVGAEWFSILFNLIWIGYFTKSKRVKETFTR